MTDNTTRSEVQGQVHAIIAGRILQKLQKLAAVEQSNLKASVTTITEHHQGDVHLGYATHTSTKRIPAKVYDSVLQKLGSLGLIRRFGYQGDVYIATETATREQLVAAITLHQGTPAKRRQDLLGRISYYEAANVPALGDSSQEADAYTLEGSTESHLDAEILPGLNEVAWQPQPHTKPLSELTQKRIRYQEKIGQGARNASRAKARWLAAEEGQMYLAVKNTQAIARKEMGLEDTLEAL